MATYLQGVSNIQPNGLQTLTLMNPALLAYSDAATPLTVSSMNHPHILHPNHTQNSSMIPTNVQGLVSYLHYSNSVDASSQLGLSLSSHATAPFWPASDVQNDIHGNQSALTGPKYLKAVQELLDEAINVGKGISVRCRIKKEGDARQKSGGGCITRLKQGIELTIQEKQAVQMKKAMLVSMLLEVEQRYRQYHNQMQLLVCSFEAVAGIGSARAYTALALQRVSKQFRCLRDAINGQIQATRKCLGEEEEEGLGETNNSLGSRLGFVDRQLRQERALQQIGVVQSNAWRPQRGLPERAVTVLRSWLFEHFLHPYPKDSEKGMLAKQTGLTKSQVSNWFINARVRLWKPMVEEMYLEETKNQQPDNADDKTISSNHSENSPTNSTKKDHASETAANLQLKKAVSDASRQQNTMPSIVEDSMIKYGHRGLSSIADAMDQETSLEAYQIGDIAAFEPNQFVSLSLRLPSQPSYIPCEFMPLQSSIDMRGDESIDDYFSIKSSNAAVVAHPSEAYDCMRFQNRKSSAAQLLPDLVA